MTFNGDNILQQADVNWPELDVPAINAAMKAASVTPVGPARNQAWAKIDQMIAEQAPAVPYLWDNIAAVQSKDVVAGCACHAGYDVTHGLHRCTEIPCQTTRRVADLQYRT